MEAPDVFRSHNPSVSFADSSLCTREPTLDFNNVEGAEGIVFYPLFYPIHCTDSFVFILIEHNTVNSDVITGDEGDYLLVADKSQFASGTAHFRLVRRFAGE